MKPFNEDKPVKAYMQNGEYSFHGDVGIFCEKLPKDFNKMQKVEDHCLAYGEATGHVHKLTDGDFDIRKSEDNVIYLNVFKPTLLKHQEHKPIEIGPGTYRIGIQKEYDHIKEMVRIVAD